MASLLHDPSLSQRASCGHPTIKTAEQTAKEEAKRSIMNSRGKEPTFFLSSLVGRLCVDIEEHNRRDSMDDVTIKVATPTSTNNTDKQTYLFPADGVTDILPLATSTHNAGIILQRGLGPEKACVGTSDLPTTTGISSRDSAVDGPAMPDVSPRESMVAHARSRRSRSRAMLMHPAPPSLVIARPSDTVDPTREAVVPVCTRGNQACPQGATSVPAVPACAETEGEVGLAVGDAMDARGTRDSHAADTAAGPGETDHPLMLAPARPTWTSKCIAHTHTHAPSESARGEGRAGDEGDETGSVPQEDGPHGAASIPSVAVARGRGYYDEGCSEKDEAAGEGVETAAREAHGAPTAPTVAPVATVLALPLPPYTAVLHTSPTAAACLRATLVPLSRVLASPLVAVPLLLGARACVCVLSSLRATLALTWILLVCALYVGLGARVLLMCALLGAVALLPILSLYLAITTHGVLALLPAWLIEPLSRVLDRSLLDAARLEWSGSSCMDIAALLLFNVAPAHRAHVLARLPPFAQRLLSLRLWELVPHSVRRILLPSAHPLLRPTAVDAGACTEPLLEAVPCAGPLEPAQAVTVWPSFAAALAEFEQLRAPPQHPVSSASSSPPLSPALPRPGMRSWGCACGVEAAKAVVMPEEPEDEEVVKDTSASEAAHARHDPRSCPRPAAAATAALAAPAAATLRALATRALAAVGLSLPVLRAHLRATQCARKQAAQVAAQGEGEVVPGAGHPATSTTELAFSSFSSSARTQAASRGAPCTPPRGARAAPRQPVLGLAHPALARAQFLTPFRPHAQLLMAAPCQPGPRFDPTKPLLFALASYGCAHLGQSLLAYVRAHSPLAALAVTRARLLWRLPWVRAMCGDDRAGDDDDDSNDADGMEGMDDTHGTEDGAQGILGAKGACACAADDHGEQGRARSWHGAAPTLALPLPPVACRTPSGPAAGPGLGSPLHGLPTAPLAATAPPRSRRLRFPSATAMGELERFSAHTAPWSPHTHRRLGYVTAALGTGFTLATVKLLLSARARLSVWRSLVRAVDVTFTLTTALALTRAILGQVHRPARAPKNTHPKDVAVHPASSTVRVVSSPGITAQPWWVRFAHTMHAWTRSSTARDALALVLLVAWALRQMRHSPR